MDMTNIENALENAQISIDEMLRHFIYDEPTPAMNDQLLAVMESVRTVLSKCKNSRRRDISDFNDFISEKQAKRSKQLVR